jgi:hypothetical protein
MSRQMDLKKPSAPPVPPPSSLLLSPTTPESVLTTPPNPNAIKAAAILEGEVLREWLIVLKNEHLLPAHTKTKLKESRQLLKSVDGKTDFTALSRHQFKKSFDGHVQKAYISRSSDTRITWKARLPYVCDTWALAVSHILAGTPPDIMLKSLTQFLTDEVEPVLKPVHLKYLKENLPKWAKTLSLRCSEGRHEGRQRCSEVHDEEKYLPQHFLNLTPDQHFFITNGRAPDPLHILKEIL